MSGAHRQAHRGRTLTGLAVALCCGAAVLVSVATAEAAPGGWEREVDRVDHLITHLDGAVSVGSCSVSTDGSTPPNAIQTISRDGASVTNVSSTLPLQPQLCSFNSEVGSDGTVYTIASDTDAKPHVAAFRNGTQLWAVVPPDPCTESQPIVAALRLGPDGNIYILNGHQTDCGGTRYYLTKLNAADGSTIFSHSVGNRSVDDFDLMPYESGVAVLDDDKLNFFGLDGTTTGVVDVPVRDGEFVARPVVNHQGRVFIDIVQDVRRTPGCEKNQITTRIAAFEAVGAVHEYGAQPCTAVRDFRPTPTGGLVVAVVEANSTDRVVGLDGNLAPAGSYDPGTGTVGGRSYEQGSHRLHVDVNGRVIVTRQYSRSRGLSGMQLTVLSSSLARQAAYFTEEFDPASAFSVGQVGLANGQIYVGYTRCGGAPCFNTDPKYVRAIPVPDIAIDYPRGVLLRAAPQPPGPDPVPDPTGCGDVAVIGVRGSGDNSNGNDYPGRHAVDIADKLRSPEYGMRLYDNDTNSADRVIGVAYPAVAVLSPDLVAYRESVRAGAENLIAEISIIRGECGDGFPVVLIGYSQGADVVQSALENLDRAVRRGDGRWSSVAGVVLLASPRFLPSDPVARGTYVRDADFRGIALGRQAEVNRRFANAANDPLVTSVTRSYCLQGDPVCVLNGRNLARGIGLHESGYTAGTATGEPIQVDAAALLAWSVEARGGRNIAPQPTGELNAYRVGDSLIRLSAAAVHANGSPTLRFRWDFTSDGVVDRTTAVPWIGHNYRPPRRGQAQQVTATVDIEHADGTVTRQTICVRANRGGAATC